MQKYAEEVLSLYPIADPHIEFIRHNENLTFQITDKAENKSYVLRIHKPRAEGLRGIQHTFEGLQSEIYLLQELHRENILQVQKPVANRAGEFVTAYATDDLGSCCVTLLEWIDGPTLTLEDDNIENIAYGLGEKLADLHNFSRNSNRLSDLTRPIYGIDTIHSAIDELKHGVATEVYSQKNYEIMIQVLSIVKNQLLELDAREHTWGLIHADLQRGNVVISDGSPCLIDYCLSGFGYYLFDLGSASTAFKSEQRDIFLRGYASKASFSTDDIRYIEGLIFMDIFISYAYFIRDPNSNGWIKEHAERVCNSLCLDFLAGKEVYYSF